MVRLSTISPADWLCSEAHWSSYTWPTGETPGTFSQITVGHTVAQTVESQPLSPSEATTAVPHYNSCFFTRWLHRRLRKTHMFGFLPNNLTAEQYRTVDAWGRSSHWCQPHAHIPAAREKPDKYQQLKRLKDASVYLHMDYFQLFPLYSEPATNKAKKQTHIC